MKACRAKIVQTFVITATFLLSLVVVPSIAQAQDGPDLIVTATKFVNKQKVDGDKLSLTIVIANLGNEPVVDPFVVEWTTLSNLEVMTEDGAQRQGGQHSTLGKIDIDEVISPGQVPEFKLKADMLPSFRGGYGTVRVDRFDTIN